MIPKSGNRFSDKIMPTQESSVVSAAEAKSLFADFINLPALMLAVSGGPDSVALMVLAARWRDARKSAPKLIAVTIDHGLRAESKGEAAGVARLARKLRVAHRTLRWIGTKPKAGLPQAARAARYRLLADAARKAGATHILTAHTLDDQAETVIIRLLRGSGLTGLGAMARIANVPGRADIKLARPLLGIAKARLIATLAAAKIPFADDPTNRDPRFTRARLRMLMPQLAEEGLDARRLSLLASRLKRADAAIEAGVDRTFADVTADSSAPGRLVFEATDYARLPAEIALRLLGRAVTELGCEGPVELGKLETLKAALDEAQRAGNGRFRRSLAGAIVTLADATVSVERAPARRQMSLTKPKRAQAKWGKAR
jgi:tRNA(Ile)-lysidine synthase